MKVLRSVPCARSRSGWAVALAILMTAFPVLAEPTEEPAEGDDNDLVAKANNPLTAASAVNLQDYYAPTVSGVPGGSANSMLVRAVLPFHLGLEQIVRVTLPLSTAPNVMGSDPVSGLGDLNIFDVLLLTPSTSKVQFGVGPQLTIPTASYDPLGTGKWQLGAAAVVTWEPAKALLLGTLVTWQAGFAGSSSRPSTDNLLVQPIGILQVGAGFYLRSTASWMFDLASGTYLVPFGVGVGKVVKLGSTALNFYLEPQFTVLHYGLGQPTEQILGGINAQFF